VSAHLILSHVKIRDININCELIIALQVLINNLIKNLHEIIVYKKWRKKKMISRDISLKYQKY